ncbi:MAG: Crp/Fnr family transcriptional regulator [Candidatus Korobacteraceae bacterium]
MPPRKSAHAAPAASPQDETLRSRRPRSPYGLDLVDRCSECTLREKYLFCDLPIPALEHLDRIKSTAAYPKGALLFLEGQAPRGIFVLCAGRAKLSTSSADGKTLILRIAQPGEVLGLSAAISGKPYEVTVEILEPAQANFVSRDHLLDFLRQHGEVAVRVAQELSNNYHSAYQEIRSLGLSSSAAEKLAKLLLEWSAEAEPGPGGVRMHMTLTHEEIAQLIGTSRETVTRALGEMRRSQLIQIRGASVIIPDRAALQELVKS